MDSLHVDLAHPLRRFRLAVELAVGRECFALVGPSGAGKTSVLRAIAGLLAPEEGSIRAGDEVWLDTGRRVSLPPEQRSVGLVFQDYALFPHMTVAENVAFGRKSEANGLLARFGIEHLERARPGELSGGERQRVALARALAREPSVLLLDEPLGSLDTTTRARVRGELAATLRSLALPTLLVTHDFAEAAALADRIGVLVDGEIVQTGTAAELLAAPASPFVADFTGANVLHGFARPGPNGLTEVALEDGTRILSTDPGAGRVALSVQPWEIALGPVADEGSAQNHVPGRVESVVPLGNRARVTVGPLTAEITAASAERLGIAPGLPLVASFKAAGVRILPL
jgi:molybdate transport system ATP-binding protein